MIEDNRQTEINNLVKLISSDPIAACNAIKEILPATLDGPNNWDRINRLGKLLFHLILKETTELNKAREKEHPDYAEEEKNEQDYLWKMFVSQFFLSMAPSLLHPYILKCLGDNFSIEDETEALRFEIQESLDELTGSDWDEIDDDDLGSSFVTDFDPSLN